MRSQDDWDNFDNMYKNHYEYECPIHGQLMSVPDEDINSLREKARLAMKSGIILSQ